MTSLIVYVCMLWHGYLPAPPADVSVLVSGRCAKNHPQGRNSHPEKNSHQRFKLQQSTLGAQVSSLEVLV